MLCKESGGLCFCIVFLSPASQADFLLHNHLSDANATLRIHSPSSEYNTAAEARHSTALALIETCWVIIRDDTVLVSVALKRLAEQQSA